MNTTISHSVLDLSDIKFRAKAIRTQKFSRLVSQFIIMIYGRGIRIDFTSRELKRDVSYIVASNHQSQLDPFVELAILNASSYERLAPYRAMSANKFFHGGFSELYVTAMGCYPAKEHNRLGYGIEQSIRLLSPSQTVMIFPEGRRTLPFAEPAKKGIAILAQQPNVEIIPMHIQWYKKNYLVRWFKITAGQPFSGKGMDAEQILARIYQLPLP